MLFRSLRTGGYIGDNGFYYHEQLGSYICIQTILTDALGPTAYSSDKQINKCTHCGACAAACPSAAVGDIQNCLKSYLYEKIPTALRPDVYQLFGCELCQSACPQNSDEKSDAHTYPLGGLLNGDFTKELKELAGKNLVRTNRLLSQAVIYAANKKEYNLAELICEISKNSKDPVCSHALWSYNKLKNDNS